MSNLNIVLEKWDVVKNKVSTANQTLFNILDPIACFLKHEKKDYIYSLQFKYGEKIIDNGQMVALSKDEQGNYINLDKLKFKYNPATLCKVFDSNIKNRFINDCGQDPDHPLALVIKNYIEISSLHEPHFFLDSKKVSRWPFPLNIIRKGELFGVFGSINSIFDTYEKDNYKWNASSGKSCFLPLFPGINGGQSSAPYRNRFSQMFSDETESPQDGIIFTANEILGSNNFSEIIIIPECYLKDGSDDVEELRRAKAKFREFLFRIAWEQSKISREISFEDKALMRYFAIEDPGLTFHLIKHIINIAHGKAFILKPVSNDDDILFEVFKNLIGKFNGSNGKYPDLLKYATPAFMHYTKLDCDNPNGIEFLHSPSINMAWPEISAAQIRDIYIRPIFDGQKMQRYFKTKGIDVDLHYYKTPPNRTVKEDKKNASYVRNIYEYFDNLNDSYSGLLGKNNKVIVHRSVPGVYNSFINIERKP
jgi:hypothetical protein